MDNSEKETNRFYFFPADRVFTDYPFFVWLAGTMALTKGCVWLYQENLTPGAFLFPMMILFGSGILNFRKWAFWGLIVVSAVELFLYAFFSFSVLKDMHAGFELGFYSKLFNICVGPGGDLLIIVSLILSAGIIRKKSMQGTGNRRRVTDART